MGLEIVGEKRGTRIGRYRGNKWWANWVRRVILRGQRLEELFELNAM